MGGVSGEDPNLASALLKLWAAMEKRERSER
jgi:hypothetical protein